MTEQELEELFAWGEEVARRAGLTPEKSRVILQAVRREKTNLPGRDWVEPKTLEEAVEILVREQLRILYERHKRYGPQNILRGGKLGVLMRMRDKLERAWTLTGLNQLGECRDAWEFAQKVAAGEIIPPPDDCGESVGDSVLDLANYALIYRLLERGWFSLPLQRPPAPSG